MNTSSTQHDMAEWTEKVLREFPHKEILTAVDDSQTTTQSDQESVDVAHLTERERMWVRSDITSPLTAAEVVDYYMIEIAGEGTADWARKRPSVSCTWSVGKNRKQAEKKLIALQRIEGVRI